MDKAPQPSPVGLVIVLAVFAFLIWHGPWDERWGEPALALEPIEVHGIDCEKDIATLTVTQIEVCSDIQVLKKD